MARLYRSAKGKSVDIDRLKLSNETSIAIGNMRVNARGDRLGVGAQIAAGRNQIMDQVYAVPDAGGYSPNDPQTHVANQAIIQASTAQELNDLANNLTVPVTQPTDTTSDAPITQPAARGSLANSVAKPTAVSQEPLPTPKEQAKSNGPSRI
jgi:hypothetical protein